MRGFGGLGLEGELGGGIGGEGGWAAQVLVMPGGEDAVAAPEVGAGEVGFKGWGDQGSATRCVEGGGGRGRCDWEVHEQQLR